MKKSREIIGLPIIGIMDGKELGKVKNLVINPEQGTVEFLTVENEEWQLGVKAIPFKSVEGVGEFAVTIERSSAIIDLAEIPVANELLVKNIHINGTKIVTRKGRFLGTVDEYFINEETGEITGVSFQMKNNGGTKVIPEKAVLTYGKEVLVVTEDVDSKLLDTMEQLDNARNTLENASDPAIQTPAFQETESPSSSGAEDFEERQRPLLVGKKVSADIQDEDGNLIIAEGQTVTNEVFDRIKALGRSKLIELTIKVND